MTLELTQSLFERYRPEPGTYDVLVRDDGTLREHWANAVGALEGLGAQELAGRTAVLDRMLDDEGISYRLVERGISMRWPLDPLPTLVPSAQWTEIESGVIQRAVLLDLVLRDLYGPRDLLDRGLLPPEVVFAHPGFLRQCDGISTAIEQQLLTYAADLGQSSDGTTIVLADRAQAPSGAGYALANRAMLSRVFPSLYRDSQVHRVAPYFRSLRAALERVADTARTDDPRIVVLTPGSQAETSFEHTYVGSYLGYPVVEGGDLTIRDGRVHLRALGRLEPVDVILRRADAEWCDPLELRPDSQLGVPGLVEASRRSNVSVVNPLGAGVLENAGILPFLPAIAEHFLGQELLLPSVATWWCGQDQSRSHVLANLSTMVVKPIGRELGVTSVFGGELSEVDRDDLARRIEAHPHRWVGQEQLRLSTVPTMVDGVISPRPSTLRTFAVARGESYVVMAGGLTRVAPTADTLDISNQTGAVSKDTWVLASEPENPSEFWLRPGPPTTATDPSSLSSRAAENLFWLGRYAERAEAVTRMLRAVHDRLEESGPEGTVCVETLLGALTLMTATAPGFVGDGAAARIADPGAELLSLACDADRTGTLAHCIRHLLHAAEAVRDQLSQDTWMVIGSIESELAALGTTTPGQPTIIQDRLGRVLQDLLALNGLAADSMVRDAGWHFMDAGRRIERASQLAALLRATVTVVHDTATDSLLFESVLVAGESIITYRRRYRSRAQIETLLDLLVADPGNPRSLRHQVDRLSNDVTLLPGGNVPGRPTPEEKLVLQLSTLLRVLDTSAVATVDESGSRPDLAVFLAAVDTALAQISDALQSRNFVQLLPQRQMVSGVAEVWT